VNVHDFSGKHPAGTPGYHIHLLAPVSRTSTAWHIGAQDVIRLGHLVRTGRFDATQVIALGGPMVREPRLLRTTLGASVPALVDGELTSDGEYADATPRVLSGSVLTGRATGDGVTDFLGRFHQQISVLPHVLKSSFLGWVSPFSGAYTHLPIYIGTWAGKPSRAFDTRLHGGHRAMVPIGSYERVMPMDIMPTHLLRAITVGDVEWAEELGVLELDEEDVALCTFVCPGKYEYGSALRRVLDQIVAEQ
jgi:Na+-transporting NADH:ubiquinone oxidoreductase subunit A